MVLRMTCLARGTKATFPTWKTVTIGTFRTTDDLVSQLKRANARTTDWSMDVITHIAPHQSEAKVELVRLTLADLGFSSAPTWVEILAAANQAGLDPVPEEIGPQLVLKYKDQPVGEWLWIGMRPIMDSVGDPSIFYLVGVGNGGTLDADHAGPNSHFNSLSGLWVFSRKAN